MNTQNTTEAATAPQGDARDLLNGEWLVRRDRLSMDERLLHTTLNTLREGVTADPRRASSEEYTAWAQRAIRHLADHVAAMQEHLTEPVDADLAAAASAEYESRARFTEAMQALRGAGGEVR